MRLDLTSDGSQDLFKLLGLMQMLLMQLLPTPFQVVKLLVPVLQYVVVALNRIAMINHFVVLDWRCRHIGMSAKNGLPILAIP